MIYGPIDGDDSMEIIQNLSDDQIAFWGCIGALIVSASMMFLSAHIRPNRHGEPVKLQANSPKIASTEQDQPSKNTDRRAA